MGQRLGIASALLADPDTLILDDPVNGMDPVGIRWIRDLLKGLAADGRTVFVSSHLMSEMALTAEHVIVVGRGRLMADMPMSELVAQAFSLAVVVCSPPSTSPVRSSGFSARRPVLGRGICDIQAAFQPVLPFTASHPGRVVTEDEVVSVPDGAQVVGCQAHQQRVLPGKTAPQIAERVQAAAYGRLRRSPTRCG